ncbi:MAG: hypothetical protein AAGD23_09730 [Pseudomonadota bacterium]
MAQASSGILLALGLMVMPLAGDAQAEPRRSLGHNTVGTSFPYHPGYFRFWFGDRDIGLLDLFYPQPPSRYRVNPDRVPPYPHERQFSRSRHVTGPDLLDQFGGAQGAYDVDAWYGWPPSDAPQNSD